MSNARNYAQLLSLAENAVLSVKDAALRRAAFQIVLADLLAHDAEEPAHHGRGKSSRSRPPKVDTVATTRKLSGGTQTYLDELLQEGFFAEQKNISELKTELQNRGHHIPVTSLSGPLQRMCKERKLRRQKTSTSGNRAVYSYSNW